MKRESVVTQPKSAMDAFGNTTGPRGSQQEELQRRGDGLSVSRYGLGSGAVITRILRYLKLASVSPLALPLPVVAKRYSRSTKPTPAWAQRRRARSGGLSHPFVP